MNKDLKSGEIVFAKQIQKSPRRGAPIATMKGHAICVMLGHMPNDKGPLPNKDQIISLLHEAGLMTVDTVVEALGNEAFEKLVTHLKQKYSGEVVQTVTP